MERHGSGSPLLASIAVLTLPTKCRSPSTRPHSDHHAAGRSRTANGSLGDDSVEHLRGRLTPLAHGRIARGWLNGDDNVTLSQLRTLTLQ
jgi:hypothetical protein